MTDLHYHARRMIEVHKDPRTDAETIRDAVNNLKQSAEINGNDDLSSAIDEYSNVLDQYIKTNDKQLRAALFYASKYWFEYMVKNKYL